MNKSIEELQEEIDELKQTVSGHNDELQGREDVGFDKAMLEVEGKIEKAFYGGWKACAKKDSTPLKALLNYQMEHRL